ncbi:carbon monoxide dehydrogenase [Candidatus Bipolaricaulota bacterium]|nr:carbon monoxide dehydrogenase [Candidatus Bipolaricaulota bacterium]HBR09879.1 carbon monoxide dehydrogenase [Candidatus Acetothermia bacterium]
MLSSKYRVVVGPEGYLSPAAASMGIVLPEPGEGLIEGVIVPEREAMDEIAEKLLTAKNPTFFPGPLVLWAWNDQAIAKAQAVKALAEAVGAKIIPMPDYRPKYPMINPEIEINPNHPNLTIWHNDIDVCVFVGVHCHYANLALKIVRGGTDCYTIALCGEFGHEDAMVSLRDVHVAEIYKLTEIVEEAKIEVGVH